MARARPPKLEFARPGANPTLATVEYVRKALQQADVPISRNRLLAILASWGHSTTRQSLNAVLRLMDQDGLVLEGSKGLIWVPEAKSESLRKAIALGRRL